MGKAKLGTRPRQVHGKVKRRAKNKIRQGKPRSLGIERDTAFKAVFLNSGLILCKNVKISITDNENKPTDATTGDLMK